MKRGDLVAVVLSGDFGKPRPALVIQSDYFADHPTVTVLPLTGTLVEAPLLRLTIEPDDSNHLHKPSQVMLDKAMTVRRDKLGETFGCLDTQTMVKVERTLALFLGLAR